MSSRVIDSLATTDALAAAFSDHTLLEAMCAFETALARAEASAGVMPQAAADAIGRAALGSDLDIDRIVAATRLHGTASIPVVEMIEARVSAVDPEAARWVHFGATSQDVFDTALVLCLRKAWSSLEADHQRISDALAGLARDHAATVMLGRTLLQPATPITFGLKAAGWLGAVTRSWTRCVSAYEHATVLQFGGASGTLAALGSHGSEVEAALARELDLAIPDAPWHAHRDRLAAFVAACGIYTGTLGKIARDIALLMQHEVGEAFEPGGGSSTMPHKRNPSGCAIVLAAASRLPGLVATMLATLGDEHERSVGGWHAEGAVVAEATQLTGAAQAAIAHVLENLTVDTARMRSNLDATRGVIFAERLRLAIAPAVGRATAADLVKTAVSTAQRSGRTLADVVAATPELSALLSADDITALVVPETYLGLADQFRRRLLAAAVDDVASGKR